MKAILTSIQPKWCRLIALGEKTIEVRKTRPKVQTPFKCYIYMSKGQRELLYVWKKGDRIWDDIYYEKDKPQFVKGRYSYENTGIFQKVVGEFVCDEIFDIEPIQDGGYVIFGGDFKDTCLTEREILKYGGGDALYGWHISDLVIYDKPKELSEFCAVDEKAVRNCEHREQSYYPFADSGYIKNGFVCNDTEDWCTKCKRKPITRPPQSWCYVEEVTM